jgi:hypothetical protein
MGDQRIDSGAAAAASGDADPGEGQGLATPGAHTGGGVGDAEDLRTPQSGPGQSDERGDAYEPAEGDTEGEQAMSRMTERAKDSGAPS